SLYSPTPNRTSAPGLLVTVVVIIDVAAAETAPIAAPILPVVSERKKTSTGAVVPPAFTVTVLLTVEVKPVGPVAENVVGEIESAKTGPGDGNRTAATASIASTTNTRKDDPSLVDRLFFMNPPLG